VRPHHEGVTGRAQITPQPLPPTADVGALLAVVLTHTTDFDVGRLGVAVLGVTSSTGTMCYEAFAVLEGRAHRRRRGERDRQRRPGLGAAGYVAGVLAGAHWCRAEIGSPRGRTTAEAAAIDTAM
jgi:hypothetical protein